MTSPYIHNTFQTPKKSLMLSWWANAMKYLWALPENRIHSILTWLIVQENFITSKKPPTRLSRRSPIHPNSAVQLSGLLHTHQAGGWVSHRASLNIQKEDICLCMKLKGNTGALPLHFGFILEIEAVCFSQILIATTLSSQTPEDHNLTLN
jgi:hypothetical protein